MSASFPGGTQRVAAAGGAAHQPHRVGEDTETVEDGGEAGHVAVAEDVDGDGDGDGDRAGGQRPPAVCGFTEALPPVGECGGDDTAEVDDDSEQGDQGDQDGAPPPAETVRPGGICTPTQIWPRRAPSAAMMYKVQAACSAARPVVPSPGGPCGSSRTSRRCRRGQVHGFLLRRMRRPSAPAPGRWARMGVNVPPGRAPNRGVRRRAGGAADRGAGGGGSGGDAEPDGRCQVRITVPAAAWRSRTRRIVPWEPCSTFATSYGLKSSRGGYADAPAPRW